MSEVVRFPNMYEVDINKGPAVKQLFPMFYGDFTANRVGAYMIKNGVAYSPGGSCSGTAILADGSTVALAGVVIGNAVYCDLVAGCYSVPGPIQVYIKWSDGTVITTVVAGFGNVKQTETGTIIDPGTIIPSVSALIADIEEAVESIPQDYAVLSDSVDAQTHFDLTVPGSYIASDGHLIANSGYATSGLIPCAADSVIILDGFWTGSASDSALAYAFYNANMLFISGANGITTKTTVTEIPTGAVYIRFSSRISQGETPVAYVANHTATAIEALQAALQATVPGDGLFVVGSANTSNGASTASTTRIRTRALFSTADFWGVQADSGYRLYVFAWNAATGAYVGTLKASGAFSTATGSVTVSAYHFSNADYLYQIVAQKEDGTADMDATDGAHIHFVRPPLGACDLRLSALERHAVTTHVGKNLVNLTDPALILSGKYVEYSSGRVRNNAGYSSVLLPILGGSIISTRRTQNAHITFFTGKPPAFSALANGVPIPGYISGLTQAAVLTNYTVPADAAWMVIATSTSYLSALQVEYGAAATAYEPYKQGVDYSLILDPPEIPGQVETIEYAVKTDGSGDFVNLRECLAAIPMTADPLKQYVINLYPGTHDIIAMYDSESDLPTNGLYLPPNTKIRGIGDKHNVIISGVRTTTSTSWSVLNIVDYADVENLTITSKNARYTIHDDFQSAVNARSTRHFRDVIFIGENCQYGSVYGSGLKGNADWEFINCEFHAENSAANGTPGNAFSLHNNNNVTRPSFVRFENCRLLNGSNSYKTLRLLSMTTGSANGGVYVTLEGNKIDGLHLGENNASQYGAGCSFWVNGFGNVNPLGVTVSSTDGVDYTDRVDLI